jgi:hypothetical protein
MTIPTQTKELLLQLRDRIPPETQDAFVASVSSRLQELLTSHTAYYTLLGGLTGFLVGRLPLVGLFTHHHEAEIGAALGAWVGLTKDHEERKQRQTIQSIVQEAIHHALA